MNRLIDGTTWRETPAGIIAIRGKRELHLLGTSVASMQKAREVLATRSFYRVFSAARRSPHSANVAFLTVSA